MKLAAHCQNINDSPSFLRGGLNAEHAFAFNTCSCSLEKACQMRQTVGLGSRVENEGADLLCVAGAGLCLSFVS